jgi:RNA polymerase sigma-70 factor (ECF subfamily)
LDLTQSPSAVATRPVDPAEVRALVDAHLGFVWRCLRRFGLSPADADDASQRVFLIAGERLERIEPGKERAFLFGVAYRVARDVKRAASRRPDSVTEEFDAADSSPGPEELTDRKRARITLDQILATMPEEVRAVFVLYELEGMTREQIAETLDTPAGTVASRLRRGRELFHSEAARHRARVAFKGGE